MCRHGHRCTADHLSSDKPLMRSILKGSSTLPSSVSSTAASLQLPGGTLLASQITTHPSSRFPEGSEKGKLLGLKMI